MSIQNEQYQEAIEICLSNNLVDLGYAIQSNLEFVDFMYNTGTIDIITDIFVDCSYGLDINDITLCILYQMEYMSVKEALIKMNDLVTQRINYRYNNLKGY